MYTRLCRLFTCTFRCCIEAAGPPPPPPWGSCLLRLIGALVGLCLPPACVTVIHIITDRILCLGLWLHPETAHWWADAKWFSETVSKRLYSLCVWRCVCVCVTATGLAVWQTALLLRNFSDQVQTLTSKSQKPFGPKRSRPVRWRWTSVLRFVSGRKASPERGIFKTKALPAIISQLEGDSLCTQSFFKKKIFYMSCF